MADFEISQLPAVTTLASGDLIPAVDIDGVAVPSGAGGGDVVITAGNLATTLVALAGGVTIDTTAAHIQPDGIQAAGSNALAADSGHVHPEKAWDSLLIAPSGALAETFPIDIINTVGLAASSGTLLVSAIPLPKGLVVSNITLLVSTTVETGGTHGWYCLLDSGLVVRAVSADQTGATFWGTANTPVTLAMGSAYTVPSAGLYYVGVCIAATTRPTFATAPSGVPVAQTAVTPLRGGTSSTGQTTPPSTGTTMTALTASTNGRFYAYVS